MTTTVAEAKHFTRCPYARGLLSLVVSCSDANESSPGFTATELEFELIQTQMAQKPMLRVEEYARAFCASQDVKRAEVWWARDAPYGSAGRGRVREWKALVWGGVISEVEVG
jgi:hypothetical protein